MKKIIYLILVILLVPTLVFAAINFNPGSFGKLFTQTDVNETDFSAVTIPIKNVGFDIQNNVLTVTYERPIFNSEGNEYRLGTFPGRIDVPLDDYQLCRELGNSKNVCISEIEAYILQIAAEHKKALLAEYENKKTETDFRTEISPTDFTLTDNDLTNAN